MIASQQFQRRSMPRRIHPLAMGFLGTCLALFSLSLVAVAAPSPSSHVTSARFVGSAQCVECHQAQHTEWSASHHAQAMLPANANTVQGNFTDATFSHRGVTTTFSTREGRYFIRTDGPTGVLEDYEAPFTFGITPLQQYLLKLPGGRYQAFTTAWDTQAKQERGQRWFHLYPSEDINHHDELHWTKVTANWNYMCAECHSTNLRKGYSPLTNSYQTTWSEMQIGCESCHGPGAEHIAWSVTKSPSVPGKGILAGHREAANHQWSFAQGARTAQRVQKRAHDLQLETCARCHSRRSMLTEDYRPGQPLLATHRPSLLSDGLYHADGQILGEVYEYGSFLQSKMHMAGVTCTNCHNPHSGKLVLNGNDLCGKCHEPAAYDSPSHHFHKKNTKGALCISCHMPSKFYMGVDERRDHSFRIPRPDLSVSIGSPNACSSCHSKQSAAWAASTIERWYGHKPSPHYGEALHAGRIGAPGAAASLLKLLADTGRPSIARATALELLAGYPSPETTREITSNAKSPDPFLRLAAATALEALPFDSRTKAGEPLLSDPLLAIRIDAGRTLAGIPVSPSKKPALDRALAEYRETQQANFDHPNARINLALLAQAQGNHAEAEQLYRGALALEPSYPPTYVNLADLYRQRGRDPEGEKVLRDGLTRSPKNPELLHALGLLLVRKKETTNALALFKQAAALRPENPRYAMVYAVALNSSGNLREALAVAERSLEHHRFDPELLFLVSTLSRDMGNLPRAHAAAKRLLDVQPESEEARLLFQQTEPRPIK